jgi:malate dehydrogenase (oxaloacetate-decarboxylating)(NADP+)
MALSNPTYKSECTAQQAYSWTDGKAIFAAGSPYSPVLYKGELFYPGQGNNMYIFPGLGFGAGTSKARTITESMITAAAKCLSNTLTNEETAAGFIYPSLSRIREISTEIATSVGEVAWRNVCSIKLSSFNKLLTLIYTPSGTVQDQTASRRP